MMDLCAWPPALIHDRLQRIELRTVQSLAAGPDVTPVGGFLVVVHPFSDRPWLNYAAPHPAWPDGPQRKQVEELRSFFRDHKRRLRVEYFEELWPDLDPVLAACGLVSEKPKPVMICSSAEFRPFSAPGVRVRELLPDAHDGQIFEFLTTLKKGFELESAVVESYEVQEQRRFVQGNVHRCAFGEWQGRMVGVGSLAQANDELAGIATLPGFRRRGVACAVSTALMSGHFAAGHDYVWLSAAGAAARGAYERIGFRAAGTQLTYVDDR